MKLSKKARTILQSALLSHPDLPRFVDSQSRVFNMTAAQLLDLAGKLDVDVGATISATEKLHSTKAFLEDYEARSSYSEKYPAFSGHLEFELEFRLLGQVVTRKARVVYEHTPDWAYFDLIKKTAMFGLERLLMWIEVLAIPERETEFGKYAASRADADFLPRWTKLDLFEEGVLPEAIREEMWRLIEEKSRGEDSQRRLK
jgi:hypothetical protein